MTTGLSVVIPTIPGRESLLGRLLWTIQEQPASAGTNVLVIGGAGPLGDKVNLGAALAPTSHMVVVDDDDLLAGCYFELVLAALDQDPDFIGYWITQQCDGRWFGQATTRGDIGTWGGTQRGPCPKGVTRTDIVRQVPMRNHYTADRDWMRHVAPLIRSSTFIDRHLYLYDYWPSISAYHGGATRDVGEWPHDESRVARITL